jgi:hypothetical protein
MRIDLWSIPVLGALAEGVVWGWLLVMMAAPARPPSRFLLLAAVLVAGTFLGMEGLSVPPLALGLAAGAAAHLLFRHLVLSHRIGSTALGGHTS